MPLVEISAERYEIAQASFPYLDSGDVAQTLDLQQLYGWTHNMNAQFSRCRVGGDVDSKAHIIGRAKPMVSFMTRDLNTYFSVISPTIGLRCEADNGGPVFRLYERQHGGAFMDLNDANSHAVVNSPGGGVIYPDSLNCGVEDVDGASMTSSFVPVWDGTVQPFVPTFGVAQNTAPVPAFISQFFLSEIHHAGSEIPGITSANVQFGLTYTGTTQSPGPYDRRYAVSDREPQFQLNGLKLDEIINLWATAISQEFAIYLQAGVNAGDRIAKDQPAHVKIACATGTLNIETVGGDVPADAEKALVVRPTSPISVTTGVTIPTP